MQKWVFIRIAAYKLQKFPLQSTIDKRVSSSILHFKFLHRYLFPMNVSDAAVQSHQIGIDESYRPLPSLYLAFSFIWLCSACSWTLNTYKNRHFQVKILPFLSTVCSALILWNGLLENQLLLLWDSFRLRAEFGGFWWFFYLFVISWLEHCGCSISASMEPTLTISLRLDYTKFRIKFNSDKLTKRSSCVFNGATCFGDFSSISMHSLLAERITSINSLDYLIL